MATTDTTGFSIITTTDDSASETWYSHVGSPALSIESSAADPKAQKVCQIIDLH